MCSSARQNLQKAQSARWWYWQAGVSGATDDSWAVLVPVGLFIYGWSAEFKTFWLVPDIGAAIFSAGVIIGFQCIQTYIVDSYTRFAASAIGAATVMRSLAGFGFPLFAPVMYRALGNGWGNSLLGFIAVGLGLPAPVLLWFYGEKLRMRSPFAAGA